MKISKVDNTRSAVVETDGIIYGDPKADVNLAQHIDKRVEAASKLYAVYNTNGLDKLRVNKDDDKRKMRKLLSQFNAMLKVVASQRNIASSQRLFFNPSRIKIKTKGKEEPICWNSYTVKNQSPEQWAEMVTTACLRKSLRKQHDYLVQLLSWFCQSEAVFVENVNKDKERATVFLEALVEDLQKNKQKKQMQYSLEQQDVKVQVVKKDDQYLLALSNYEHKKKQAAFQLMREYAQDGSVLREKLLYGYVNKFFGVDEKEWSALQLESILPKGIPVFADGRKAGQSDYKQAKSELHKWLLERYRAAAKDADDQAVFWYELIQDFLEAYFANKKHITEDKLTYQYVMRQVQGKLSHYLLSKFIDMGKAVYHFCDMNNADKMKIGQVLPQYTKSSASNKLMGITSFDYEYIKAKEALEQNFAVSLVYAINNFGQIFSEDCLKEAKKDDYLLLEMSEVCAKTKDLQKSLLRFWGGASQWDTTNLDACALAKEIQQNLYALRNHSFHYGSQDESLKGDKKETVLNLRLLLAQENQKYSQSVYTKYLNNNVFCYYPKADVLRLIQDLHQTPKYTPSFVPAFGSAVKRSQMPMWMKEAGISVPETGQQAEQLRSALYFVLKEIYYYDFLRDDSQILERFKTAVFAERDAINQQLSEHKNKANKELQRKWEQREKAMQNFLDTIGIKNKGVTFAQICQRALMTYALHNNTTYRDAAKKQEMETYAHYKMILNNMVGKAFFAYVQEKYAFLLKPFQKCMDNIPAEELLKEAAQKGVLQEYTSLFADMQEDPQLLAYYAFGKFLPPKQLNLLVGDLKNYQQFAADIQKRGGYAECTVQIEEAVNYRKIAEILQFCLLTNGQVSNCFDDYYPDKNAYADYLRNYVAFEDSGYQQSYGDLEVFCNDMTKELGETYRVYQDGKNPILYSGIELTRLYGMDTVLSHAIQDKVTMADVKSLKKLIEKDLKDVLPRGECFNKKEQSALKRYQEIKQRIELTELQSYSNLLYDCYAPMVNWCYMRERDNMYLLLGYHYVKQFWPLEDTFIYPMVDKISKLYQYGKKLEFDLPPGTPEDAPIRSKRKEFKNQLTVQGGAKISTKRKWLEKWFGPEIFRPEELLYGSNDKMTGKYARFSDSQEVESYSEKENRYRDFRNDIDHFAYFHQQQVSILELYQNAYYYMGYDKKIQNAVIDKLQHILERYFVTTDICWTEKGLALRQPKPAKNNKNDKNSNGFDDNNAVVPQQFTYVTKEDGKVLVNAHSKKFCKHIEQLLTYSQKNEI